MGETPRPVRMPRTRAVDRIRYLRWLARGRRVIHLGFAERRGGGWVREGSDELWLHARLRETARELVGIDIDPSGVERARAEGFEAYEADCADPRAVSALGIAPADLVVAGELIEHMERPGDLLDAAGVLLEPEGSLVITTPNAASLLNPLAAMGRYELANPDHVAFYSWFTLSALLTRHGYRVERFLTYHRPLATGTRPGDAAQAAARAAAAVQRALARWWPFLDFGLIAVARPGPS